jgi:CBS domain-containing protein
MTNTKEFLRNTSPFNLLPTEALDFVAENVKYVKFEHNQTIYHQHKTTIVSIDLIYTGSYETFVYDKNNKKKVPSILSTNEIYGAFSALVNNSKSIHTVSVKKGTEVFKLAVADFKKLCAQYPDFYQFFLNVFGKEMLSDEFSHYMTYYKYEDEMSGFDKYFSRRIDSIVIRPIIRVGPQTPIYQVAESMNYHKMSCIFIEEHGQLIGYVTDITMRDRVVAAQRHSHEPVINIMDGPISSIPNDTYVYEAILHMFRNKIRYLVVEEDGNQIGVISRNKLLSDQTESPFMFIQSVRHASSTEELKSKWGEVPDVVYQLLTRGVKSELVNQVITSVSDSIVQKVIEKTIEDMGEPPAKFVFMALGSEGRKEQTLKTDQDNAIIYEDKANEHRKKTRKYFLAFAERVSEDLNYIGFTFCTGGLMAKNPKWTHSLSYWKRNYNEWIDSPDPEAIMNFSTFFDCRLIYGEQKLIDDLKSHIVEKLESPSEYFFVQLANNALLYEPPLTFFKTIKTIAKGDLKVFNIKHAMTPLVDLVRVFALKHKIIRTNTGDRLMYLKNKEVFSENDYNELMQSYYYLMGMRLKHQAHQLIYDKQEPDNFINPDTLTKIEKVTLTQIFKVIESFQVRIKQMFMRKLY